jgi:hypothetical protein
MTFIASTDVVVGIVRFRVTQPREVVSVGRSSIMTLIIQTKGADEFNNC